MVQMGGVWQYELEVYCGGSLSSRLRSLCGPISLDILIPSLRYPHMLRNTLLGRLALPPKKWCDAAPLVLSLHRHNCAIPHLATYRATIVRQPPPPQQKKTSTKEFCDTIATSIARYEKYRYWASKLEARKAPRYKGGGGYSGTNWRCCFSIALRFRKKARNLKRSFRILFENFSEICPETQSSPKCFPSEMSGFKSKSQSEIS